MSISANVQALQDTCTARGISFTRNICTRWSWMVRARSHTVEVFDDMVKIDGKVLHTVNPSDILKAL